MSTGGRSFQIDKLLETVVKERVSDLHITVGQPPVIRSGGRMVRLETRTLTGEDTTNLMKSITPERNQQELQESGTTDFAVGMHESRFRVSIHRMQYEDQAKVDLVKAFVTYVGSDEGQAAAAAAAGSAPLSDEVQAAIAESIAAISVAG